MVSFLITAVLMVATITVPVQAQADSARIIAWGTLLNPDTVMDEAQQLAQSVANPDSSQWRAKGDQKRTYWFAEADAAVPYRIVIPPTWDGTSELPLILFLHSGGANENTNLDANNKQLVNLAIEHGYALVSPLGYQGAYGFHLRLPAVFGQQASANQQIAAVTAASERTNQLSEIDVMNVLEIVLHEYPIDRNRMFLAGHSMGAGGTWYLGAKYPGYWAALAPLSGPFVHVEGYPWDNIRPMPTFVTEGDNTASTAASRAVHEYMLANEFDVTYKEVIADHEGMIPLVLPDVFDFFNDNPKTVSVSPRRIAARSAGPSGFSARFTTSQTLRITLPAHHGSTRALISISNAAGQEVTHGSFTAPDGEVVLNGLALPFGAYHVRIRVGTESGFARFMVMK